MKKVFLLGVFIIALAGIISAGVIPFPVDSDNDGVEDSLDLCPNTVSGSIVNSDGCSIVQLCRGDYKNHGQYVSCVAHASQSFVEQGLITGEQKGEIVSEAARSDIGKK